MDQLLTIWQVASMLCTLLWTRSLFSAQQPCPVLQPTALGNPAADLYSAQHTGSTPQSSSLWEVPEADQKQYHGQLSHHPYDSRLYGYLRLQINIVIYVLYCGCLFEQPHSIPHVIGDPR